MSRPIWITADNISEAERLHALVGSASAERPDDLLFASKVPKLINAALARGLASIAADLEKPKECAPEEIEAGKPKELEPDPVLAQLGIGRDGAVAADPFGGGS